MFINIHFSTFGLILNRKTTEFCTVLQTSQNGIENRLMLNSLGVNKYFFEEEFLKKKTIEEIYSFFKIAGGRANSFRFKDEFDYKALNERIEDNQLTKTYEVQGRILKKPISKPRKDSLKIEYFNSFLEEEKDFIVDYNTGFIQFLSHFDAQNLKASFEFDTEVRFESDELFLEKDVFGNMFFKDLTLIEVL